MDSTFFYPDDFGVKKFHVSPFEATSEWYEFEMFENISLSDCDTDVIRDIESLLNFSPTNLI